MTLQELKTEIEKYQYFEDTGIINVALASIVATRLQIGDPVWFIMIGPPSGGKSQILRPLALTDEKFMHKVDDLTENTFLSSMGGKDTDNSLLSKIGSLGMIVISDLTVLFSKNSEAKNAILSQFRMIYDGEMTKHSGNKKDATSWKGSLGIIAGSTPTIYRHFEEVADMGERFIYYRMKEYDKEKATRLSMKRELYGKKLDDVLSALYLEYLKGIVGSNTEPIVVSDEVEERILRVSILAEEIRTPIHMDWRGLEVERIPVSAMPMRTARQLRSIAIGLIAMRRHEGQALQDEDLEAIEWCGYSLANEEKRACLRVICGMPYGVTITNQTMGDAIGLSTNVAGRVLQNLASVGVLQRSGGEGLSWKINSVENWKLIRRMERITEDVFYEDRQLTIDESDSYNQSIENKFERI